MKMEKPHGGTQGIGQELVKRCVSWLECFTKWAVGQAELLMLAAILAGGLLI